PMSVYCSSLLTRTATTDTDTLSLHDALPISGEKMARITVDDCLEKIPNRFQLTLVAAYRARQLANGSEPLVNTHGLRDKATVLADRKSTRLNSSHVKISYAVFCLKKKITYRV